MLNSEIGTRESCNYKHGRSNPTYDGQKYCPIHKSRASLKARDICLKKSVGVAFVGEGIQVASAIDDAVQSSKQHRYKSCYRTEKECWGNGVRDDKGEAIGRWWLKSHQIPCLGATSVILSYPRSRLARPTHITA
jgi:hypothetical protein